MVTSVYYASFPNIVTRSKNCIDIISSRNICCCQLYYKNNAIKEAQVMKKLLQNKSSGKKSWYKSDYITNRPPVSSSSISKIERNHKRTIVLNKLFMQHITNMMATGEIASDLIGRGIQISRVQVAPDFNKINVFWLANGTEKDDEVEVILKRSSGQLRHELTQLHVIGMVPRIEFIKDKQYAKLVEVDRILATADFGEDYVPVNAGYNFKSQFTLNTPLPPAIKHHTENSDNEVPEQPLPSIRMDVLGLKHDDIMAKVKKSMKKSQALHRQEPSAHMAVQHNSQEVASFSVKKEQLTKFLMRRQSAHKSRKNSSPEIELYETEVLEKIRIMPDFMDNTREEQDYLDDNESSTM